MNYYCKCCCDTLLGNCSMRMVHLAGHWHIYFKKQVCQCPVWIKNTCYTIGEMNIVCVHFNLAKCYL